MGLKENLEIAEAVIADIAKLGILSANKIAHRITASGGIQRVIGTDQGTRAKNPGIAGIRLASLRSRLPDLEFDAMTADSVRKSAHRVETAKSGNCHELAMVAAARMIDKGGTPVHLMKFTAEDYDHVWATIGVHAGWQPHNLRSWGDDAIWVDPWQTDDGIAFSIRDFVAGRVRNLSALYHCASPEEVEKGDIQGVQVG